MFSYIYFAFYVCYILLHSLPKNKNKTLQTLLLNTNICALSSSILCEHCNLSCHSVGVSWLRHKLRNHSTFLSSVKGRKYTKLLQYACRLTYIHICIYFTPKLKISVAWKYVVSSKYNRHSEERLNTAISFFYNSPHSGFCGQYLHYFQQCFWHRVSVFQVSSQRAFSPP